MAASEAYDQLDENQKQQLLSSRDSSHSTAMTARGVIRGGASAFKKIQNQVSSLYEVKIYHESTMLWKMRECLLNSVHFYLQSSDYLLSNGIFLKI